MTLAHEYKLPREYKLTQAFRGYLKSIGYTPPPGTTSIVTNIVAPPRFKFKKL